MKLPVGTLAIGSWPREKISAKVPLSAIKTGAARLPPSDYAFGASHCAIDGGIGFAAAPSPAKITCAAL
jgi:hypothetical protein